MKEIYIEVGEKAILELWNEKLNAFIIGFEGSIDEIRKIKDIISNIKINTTSSVIPKNISSDAIVHKGQEKKFKCCGKEFGFKEYVYHLMRKHKIYWWEEFITTVFSNQTFTYEDVRNELKEREIYCSQQTIYNAVKKLVNKGVIKKLERGVFRCEIENNLNEDKKVMDNIIK